MRTIFLCLSVCFVWIQAAAQKNDYIWCIGSSSELGGGIADSSILLNFNTSPASVELVQRGICQGMGPVNICDTSGNLLFYSNGMFVYDSTYQQMQGGDSINYGYWYEDRMGMGYLIPGGNLILPDPGNAQRYYLFHQFWYDAVNVPFVQQRYSLIDMTENGGRGAVIEKNVVIADSVRLSHLEAIKHANGRDWWIVVPHYGVQGFHRFLLTDQGIVESGIQSNIGGELDGAQFRGQANFSPDGSRYARYDFSNDLDIFDFDRCTGLMSNHQHIAIHDATDAWGYRTGLSFSPNSRFLYLSSHAYIYQFDLWESDIAASKDTVAFYDGYVWVGISTDHTDFEEAQLGPDGKIYITAGNTAIMHVIANPDEKGDACNFQQRQIEAPRRIGGLPNMPHFRTPALPETACLSSTADVPMEQPFRLYPNPARTEIWLEWSGDAAQVECFDLQGRSVQAARVETRHALSLSVADLPAGMYICRIRTADAVFVAPFVVER